MAHKVHARRNADAPSSNPHHRTHVNAAREVVYPTGAPELWLHPDLYDPSEPGAYPLSPGALNLDPAYVYQNLRPVLQSPAIDPDIQAERYVFGWLHAQGYAMRGDWWWPGVAEFVRDYDYWPLPRGINVAHYRLQNGRVYGLRWIDKGEAKARAEGRDVWTMKPARELMISSTVRAFGDLLARITEARAEVEADAHHAEYAAQLVAPLPDARVLAMIQNLAGRESSAHLHRAAVAEAGRRGLLVSVPEATVAVAEPSPKKAQRVRRPRAAAPSDATRLRDALAQRAGSVIDGGVRANKEDPRRFKSYYATLLSAAAQLGAEELAVVKEIDRGEIEVLTREPGLGRHRGLGGHSDAAILEYIVHDNLTLGVPAPPPSSRRRAGTTQKPPGGQGNFSFNPRSPRKPSAGQSLLAPTVGVLGPVAPGQDQLLVTYDDRGRIVASAGFGDAAASWTRPGDALIEALVRAHGVVHPHLTDDVYRAEVAATLRRDGPWWTAWVQTGVRSDPLRTAALRLADEFSRWYTDTSGSPERVPHVTLCGPGRAPEQFVSLRERIQAELLAAGASPGQKTWEVAGEVETAVRDARFVEALDPKYPTLRRAFERVTGVKLPRTLTATIAYFNGPRQFWVPRDVHARPPPETAAPRVTFGAFRRPKIAGDSYDLDVSRGDDVVGTIEAEVHNFSHGMSKDWRVSGYTVRLYAPEHGVDAEREFPAAGSARGAPPPEATRAAFERAKAWTRETLGAPAAPSVRRPPRAKTNGGRRAAKDAPAPLRSRATAEARARADTSGRSGLLVLAGGGFYVWYKLPGEAAPRILDRYDRRVDPRTLVPAAVVEFTSLVRQPELEVSYADIFPKGAS